MASDEKFGDKIKFVVSFCCQTQAECVLCEFLLDSAFMAARRHKSFHVSQFFMDLASINSGIVRLVASRAGNLAFYNWKIFVSSPKKTSNFCYFRFFPGLSLVCISINIFCKLWSTMCWCMLAISKDEKEKSETIWRWHISHYGNVFNEWIIG